MKILHVCLACFYIDKSTYQENLLPKYHKKMGFEVEILASRLSFNNNGDQCLVPPGQYINEDGILVKRLDYNKVLGERISKFLRIYSKVEDFLNKSNPDIIFIHGCQFLDILKIKKFVKRSKKNISIFVDNHADFSNSARNFLSKNIMHKLIWKFCARQILPYTSKFYGVLPARVSFLRDIYKLPINKIELLEMGVDTDLAKSVNTIDNKKNIRKKLNIDENDFVFITGGKIDKSKKQVISLLKVFSTIHIPNVKLIVFGSIIEEYKQIITNICNKNSNIIYVGWLDNYDCAKYIAASDIAIYPGRHSVLWEETTGLGIPMIVKYWEGTDHIDMGGNVIFLYDDSEVELLQSINLVLKEKKLYNKMKDVAMSKGMEKFSYYNIAERSIKI